MRESLKITALFAFAILLFAPLQSWARNFVVVIDAGHGGRDTGAIGLISKEKDINLSVAKKLGKLIENGTDNVKVVYTRTKDKYLTLQQRADIANNASGDLFISIHVNSISKKARNRKTIAGASVYTLGLHRTQENLDVAMRENSVIELEDDYSTTYSGFDPNSSESYIIFELNQDKHLEQSIELASDIQNEFITTAGRKDRGVRQAGFLVLAATSMPSILVELDFICNPTQEKFLSSENGQKKMAKAMFNAFLRYKQRYDRFEQDTTQDNIETVNNATEYRIQILTSDTPLPASDIQFKGLSPIDHYTDGSTYKYTYGRTTSWEKATDMLPEIRQKFPEAFIITMLNGNRIK